MNSTISWPDKSLAVEIYYHPEILRQLETAAADGLLAMPRTGLGIGGWLLGKRGEHRIDILGFAPIECSHAMGPGFALTEEELAAALGGVPASDDGGSPQVVGCYWSKPNGRLMLTTQDHALFQSLCAERWQAALMIRPALGRLTMAAFGMRGSAGGLMLGVPHEMVRRETTVAPEPEERDEFVDTPVGAEPAASGSAPLNEPPVLPLSEQKAEIAPESVADTMTAAVPLTVPAAANFTAPRGSTLFGVPDQPYVPSKKTNWGVLVLGIVVVIAVLVAGVFFVRGIR